MSPTTTRVKPLAVPTRVGVVTGALPFHPQAQSWPLVIAAALVWPTLKSVTLARVRTLLSDVQIGRASCRERVLCVV